MKLKKFNPFEIILDDYEKGFNEGIKKAIEIVNKNNWIYSSVNECNCGMQFNERISIRRLKQLLEKEMKK